MCQAYNTSNSESWGKGFKSSRPFLSHKSEFKTNLVNLAKPCLKIKNKKGLGIGDAVFWQHVQGSGYWGWGWGWTHGWDTAPMCCKHRHKQILPCSELTPGWVAKPLFLPCPPENFSTNKIQPETLELIEMFYWLRHWPQSAAYSVQHNLIFLHIKGRKKNAKQAEYGLEKRTL